MRDEGPEVRRDKEFEEMQEPDVQPEEMPEMGQELEEEATTSEIAASEEAQSEKAEEKKEQKTYTEEIRVTGKQLQETIEKLLRESSVRRIKVKNKQGRVLLDIPVWAAAAGSVAVLIASVPVFVVGALGGALYGLRVEVERVEESK